MNTAFISDGDIALLEHQVLQDTEFLEEDRMPYLCGVHDMANVVITFIQNKYPNVKEGE